VLKVLHWLLMKATLVPRVCAIFVTRNPQPTFVSNVSSVAELVGRIVVVDNASSSEAQQFLLKLHRQGCEIIRNNTNLGIAVALNQGIRIALAAGYDWVATFDQDSRASEGFILQMLETYQKASDAERIAIVAPTYVDRELGLRSPLLRASNGEILAAMTSGSLMPANAIRRLGMFDESLYMDYVDIEYCLRARQQGMLIVHSPTILYHSLGRITTHRLLGRAFATTNHSAGRRYYITRNRLRMLVRYMADWRWAWREIKAILFEAFKIALVEENKWTKFQAMMAGTADALRGRTGMQIEL